MPTRLVLTGLVALFLSACQPSPEETTPNVVDAEPPALTGTYTLSASGHEGELKVGQLDREAIRFDLSLVGPAPAYNQGFMEGEAWLNAEGTQAAYAIDDFGATCELTFTFDAEGVTIETLQGTPPDCGFGHRVMADGTYTRTRTEDPFLPAWATQSMHLSGTWQSVDDPLSQLVLDDGQYIDRYDGEAFPARTYAFHSTCPSECDAPPSVDQPCLAVAGEFDLSCYVVFDATADTLRLSLLGGNGQFLTYTRR